MKTETEITELRKAILIDIENSNENEKKELMAQIEILDWVIDKK